MRSLPRLHVDADVSIPVFIQLFINVDPKLLVTNPSDSGEVGRVVSSGIPGRKTTSPTGFILKRSFGCGGTVGYGFMR